MGAFHAYDIRGVRNEDFDAATVYKVGYFLPQLLGAQRILVGRDCRLSSDEIHRALLAGITDAGADVADLGLSTTPMVYFGTARYGFKASVQITASHNPARYNGLKVSRENALPVGLESGLGQIKAWIDEGRPTPTAARRGKVEGMDIRAEYLAFLQDFRKDYGGLRIVADLSNGMSNLFAPQLLGKEVIYLNDTMDGHFPGHEPNPLDPANIVQIRQAVRQEKADIGVIYDGDADRVMFIDEKGDFVSPDLMIALMGHWFFGFGDRGLAATEGKIPGAKVLQDIRSSKAVGEYLAPMGVQMHTWKVGRAYAAARLRELDGLYGGELAGHYYFKDFFYSDSGLLASLIILDILARFKQAEGRTLSSLIAGIVRYHSSGEMNFRVEDKQGAMERVKAFFTAEEKPQREMDFDGYRVEFPRWWFNIRPSNTEPYLRLIVEADDETLLKEKVSAAERIIRNCI